MAITPVSKKAFVILAACEKTKNSFAITVDPKGGSILPFHRPELKFVWAFKIDKEKAHRERFDTNHVKGRITLDDNYPGCPFCQEKNFYLCGNCGIIVCYHGQKYVTCPSCGSGGEVEYAENFDLKGGGL